MPFAFNIKKNTNSVSYHLHGSRATQARLVSHTCRAREQRLPYARELQAILAGFAYQTRGLCRQNLTGLLVKLGDIACHTRRDCLLRRLTTDVTPLK